MDKLVIFDIDRTIYNGSIFLDLSLQLVQKEIVSPKFLSSLGFEFFTYQTGFESYDQLVRDCLNYFHDEIKFLDPNDLIKETKECLFKNNHKFYDYFNKTLKNYPRYNYMLISLEPDFIVNEVANFFKIQNFASNKFIEKESFAKDLNLIFNKNTLISHTKFKDVQPFAVFGDSESDLPILEKANHKFIINPTSNLQKLVTEKNLNLKFYSQDNIFDDIQKIF